MQICTVIVHDIHTLDYQRTHILLFNYFQQYILNNTNITVWSIQKKCKSPVYIQCHVPGWHYITPLYIIFMPMAALSPAVYRVSVVPTLLFVLQVNLREPHSANLSRNFKSLNFQSRTGNFPKSKNVSVSLTQTCTIHLLKACWICCQALVRNQFSSR